MDELHDDRGWLRGGGMEATMAGWSSTAAKQPLDPFADMSDWDAVGDVVSMLPVPSSSWQSSMHEHDSTFPSAFPPFSDPTSSLSSPSNLLAASASFSFPTSAPRAAQAPYMPNNHSQTATFLPHFTKPAVDQQWPSRTPTQTTAADLTSPRLSLASTVASSSASSAPSSVISSSPASPLIISQTARRPESIRVPPFDRPSFLPPTSLPSLLPSAPLIFSSSAAGTPSSTAEPSKYQSRDMTSGTPIFSSSSMSPPTVQPRQLSRPPLSHPQSTSSSPLSTQSAAASPVPTPDRAPSPTVAFGSMSLATGSPLLSADSLAQPLSVSPSQPHTGKERRQTSIRANRKQTEVAHMAGGQRSASAGQSPLQLASASVLAASALHTAGLTPPGVKRKASRKLGVMIDVPIKMSGTAAAALTGGLSGSTPTKARRVKNKAATGAFSPHSFTSSPQSPQQVFTAPVVASISPLTEQRTVRTAGVTVASPVQSNNRLAPYLANQQPTSPPVQGSFPNYFNPHQQHGALATAVRALSAYEDDNRNMAAQQHQHALLNQNKQREEYKSNEDSLTTRAPAHFTNGDSLRFNAANHHSQPSTPYHPGDSLQTNVHPASALSQPPQPAWARQYSAPAAAPLYANESAGEPDTSERGEFTAHQPQALGHGSSSDRSYKPAADMHPPAPWAEQQQQYPNSRAVHSLPATPLDRSPYPDTSPYPPPQSGYVDDSASSALLSKLAARLSAMQRSTSAPNQSLLPLQRDLENMHRNEPRDGHSTAIAEQRTSMGARQQVQPHANRTNTPATMAQQQQLLLEHFKRSNPALQALSPEATAFLAALMGAEHAQQQAALGSGGSQLMHTASGVQHVPPSNVSRPPPSSASPPQPSPPPAHTQPVHPASMPPFTEKQLLAMQQHLSVQQRSLQHKLVQQMQHQGGRPSNHNGASTFVQQQQQIDSRHIAAGQHQPAGLPSATREELTSCPMSSAGCKLQFRSANAMQEHFLTTHMS